MRGKLCSIGYNVLALCEVGYLYSFLFSSLKMKCYIGVLANSVSEVFSIINSSTFFIESTIKELSKIVLAILYLML